jgi:hypothetical protein
MDAKSLKVVQENATTRCSRGRCRAVRSHSHEARPGVGSGMAMTALAGFQLATDQPKCRSPTPKCWKDQEAGGQLCSRPRVAGPRGALGKNSR